MPLNETAFRSIVVMSSMTSTSRQAVPVSSRRPGAVRSSMSGSKGHINSASGLGMWSEGLPWSRNWRRPDANSMASLGHVAVGMAAGRLWTGLQRQNEPGSSRARAVDVAFSALSLAPDLDVIAFRLGIPYSAPFGHRGQRTPSPPPCSPASQRSRCEIGRPGQLRPDQEATPVLCAVVAISHGLLDTLTDGVSASRSLWPFSNERFFRAVTPIPVAPSERGC